MGKQLSATEGVQALPAEKPELVAANAAGKPEMRVKPKKVVNRKLPKSPSESGESGKSGVPKKSKDKSMLNNFKDFLHSKLKKHGERKQQQGDCDVFHGFSDEEIRSASANDSSSERSSIISSLSREEKDERKKKRKTEAA